MNAAQTPARGAEIAPVGADVDAEPDHPDPAAAMADKPTVSANREAARYRRQLRETESERDTLRDRLAALQRAEIERLAGTAAKLAAPSAIWASGVQLADLLDGDGQVDPERVAAAAEQAAQRLGLARTPTRPRADPSQGPRGSGVGEPNWSQFLANNR